MKKTRNIQLDKSLKGKKIEDLMETELCHLFKKTLELGHEENYNLSGYPFLDYRLSENPDFNMDKAMDFYENTIRYLSKRRLLKGRIGTLNHELIHGSVAMGFDWPPSLILARGLVIRFNKDGAIESCNEKNFNGLRHSIKDYTTGICFFHEVAEGHVKLESLIAVLLAPPHADQLTFKMCKKSFECFKRANANKTKGRKTRGNSDLSRANRLLSGKETPESMVKSIEYNYKELTGDRIIGIGKTNGNKKNLQRMIKETD